MVVISWILTVYHLPFQPVFIQCWFVGHLQRRSIFSN